MDIPDEQVERALMKLLADGKVTVSPEMAARIAQAAGAGGNPLGATCVVEKAVPGQLRGSSYAPWSLKRSRDRRWKTW